MASTWKRCNLGDVIAIKHGYAFEGQYFSDTPAENVLLTPGNFEIGGGFRGAKLKYYSGPVDSDYILTPGSLIVTMTDLSKEMDTLGYPAWSPDCGVKPVLHNQRLGLVSKASDDVDMSFVYYVLCSRGYRNEVLAGSTGTTVHHTSPGRILAYSFDLPPLDEQRSIATTLSSLDDKIASNRRAIDLAEQLADSIFVSSAMRSTKLADVAEVVMGSSPPGESYNEDGDGVPFYQGVRDFGHRFPRHRVWTKSPVRMAQQDDSLLSVRAPVGELNRAFESCCVGRGVAAVRSPHPSATYYALRATPEIWEPFQKEGTVFGAVNRGDVVNARVRWPEEGHLQTVESDLNAIDQRIAGLSVETQRLVVTRDVLLPALLSRRIALTALEEVTA